jgi:hypothetical protein
MADTATASAFGQALRDQDDTALAAWADSLEESGDEEGATALRAMPGMLQRIEAAFRALVDYGFPEEKLEVGLASGSFPPFADDQVDEWCWEVFAVSSRITRSERVIISQKGLEWETWEMRCELPTGEAVRQLSDPVRVVLQRWAEFHPAVEWIGRRLDRTMLDVHRPSTSPPFDVVSRNLRRSNLSALAGENVRVCTLRRPRSRRRNLQA